MTDCHYLILIEADETGCSAFAPDLPGRVATGPSRDDVQRAMRDAIAFHLDGLQRAGEPVPEPTNLTTAYVEVAE